MQRRNYQQEILKDDLLDLDYLDLELEEECMKKKIFIASRIIHTLRSKLIAEIYSK